MLVGDGVTTTDALRLFPIGVDQAKDVFFRRLQITEPGPGYIHFPEQQEDGLDSEFFVQLGAERAIVKYRKGVPRREYHQTRKRNEAIDLFVYSMAVLQILGPAVTENFETLERQVRSAGERKGQLVPEQPRRSRASSWVNRWKG